MLPTKFHFIWPSAFKGKAFVEIDQSVPMEGSVLSFLKAE
jgi:hypothetical protein